MRPYLHCTQHIELEDWKGPVRAVGICNAAERDLHAAQLQEAAGHRLGSYEAPAVESLSIPWIYRTNRQSDIQDAVPPTSGTTQIRPWQRPLSQPFA